MFLEFHEFETKYSAGTYKRHRTTIYVEYMLNYIVRGGDCHMLVDFNLTFDLHKNAYSPKSALYRHHGVSN